LELMNLIQGSGLPTIDKQDKAPIPVTFRARSTAMSEPLP
jgi:hypothetical protein